MKRRKIAVLRGGPSSEHEVSLKTGRSVIDTLKDDHDILDVVIDKQGKWFVNGIEKKPTEVVRLMDVVFNAMHGEYGEDGQVQEILEILGVPFTGPKKLGAAISMNKQKTKDILKKAGIKTPNYKSYNLKSKDEVGEVSRKIFNSFSFPLVLKATSKGSSVGVYIVQNMEELRDALCKLYQESPDFICEEYIKGKEGTVGVIDCFRGEDSYSLLPIEIVPPDSKQFFDYECKYDGSTKEICPGNFTKAESQEMQRVAKLAHELLGLRHYSRSDFMVHPKRGVFFLETNSLPGMTSESLLPKAVKAVGSTYKDFLEHVIDLAIDRK
ncbi:D-alanine--D-alanine ligase [Candidatus Nomurabacteria bacterium]|nr:D-alanine--D-alanine ligase [Candidatus Nomurabacteria bacterium]